MFEINLSSTLFIGSYVMLGFWWRARRSFNFCRVGMGRVVSFRCKFDAFGDLRIP